MILKTDTIVRIESTEIYPHKCNQLFFFYKMGIKPVEKDNIFLTCGAAGTIGHPFANIK